MRKLWVLVKLDFRAMLHAFSMRNTRGGRRKAKAVSGVGALLLIAFLALYVSGVYSFLLAAMLAQVGLLEMILPLMALLACAMALMITLPAAGGLVFGAKDNDIMLALPVPALFVVLGKVLSLYLENLVFCGLWMLPTGAAYLFNAGLSAGAAALFCVRLLVAALFLPLLPSFLSLLGGWLMAYVSGRLRHRAIVGTVLGMLLLVAVLAGSMQINNLAAALLQNIDAVNHALATWLLPMGLLMRGLTGGVLALAGFATICFVPFCAAAWLISTQYKRILSALGSHVMRSDYKLRQVKANSRLAALLKKEFGRYFGSAIYVMNTAFGAVILLGFAGYVLYARGQAALVVAQMGGPSAVAPLVALVVCAVQSTINTTCVSISMEGKTLWILKEAPVPPRQLFGAKVLMNLLISVVPGVISVLLVWFALGLPAAQTLTTVALCACFGLFTSLAGLVVNLLLPKLDCENDTIVVKQSASVLVAIFGGMLLVGLGALLWVLAGSRLGLVWFGCLVCAVLLAACAGLWRWLLGAGARRLREL